MSLDCNTVRGKTFVAAGEDAGRKFAHQYNLEVVFTPPDSPADIDALFIRGSQLVGIAEIKSRAMSQPELERFGSYLITFDKLVRGISLSKSLCVSFTLIVLLMKDDLIAYWKITDATGLLVSDIIIRPSSTQETCNGGGIVRTNAYLPYKSARII